MYFIDVYIGPRHIYTCIHNHMNIYINDRIMNEREGHHDEESSLLTVHEHSRNGYKTVSGNDKA
jgi:hypothetical protein